MVAVAVIPLVASFLAATLIIRDEAVSNARERLSAINSGLASDLARTAENMQAELHALAGSSAVSQRDTPLEIVQLQLEEFQRNFVPFEDLTLLNLEGRVLASSSYFYVGDWRQNKVYQGAVGGLSPMSDILVIPGQEGLFHSHAVSVSDSSGQWGVLVGMMPNAGFNRTANDAHVGEGGLAFLTNANGRFISHPEPSQVLERWEEGASLLAGEGEGTAWVPILGSDFLCAYTDIPIPDKVGKPWNVVTCQTKAVILGTATSTQTVLILAILGALALATLAALVLSRRLAAPIHRLVQGVRRFQQGDLSFQIEPKTSDEVADVATSFNSMASALAGKITELERAEVRLEGANQELEARVEARTSELRSANEKMSGKIAERKRAEEERERLLEEASASRGQLRALSQRLVEVQEAERRYLALELHDEIGQALTGLKLTLDRSMRLSTDPTRAGLDEAHAQVDGLMERVRELSLDLRPAMLDDLGLLPALLWYFERHSAQTNVWVDFSHDGLDRRFQPEAETAAYRIVQEGLTNVARHASVTEAMVRLWVNNGTIGILIEDQGPASIPKQRWQPVPPAALRGCGSGPSCWAVSFSWTLLLVRARD